MGNITGITIGNYDRVSKASRRRSPKRLPTPSPLNSPVVAVRLDPLVLATAQEIMRPGERLVIVSPTEALLTHQAHR